MWEAFVARNNLEALESRNVGEPKRFAVVSGFGVWTEVPASFQPRVHAG